ncbi:MAG TPA: hypothetical protein VGD95_06930 [Micavibrio sp.]
MAFNRHPHISGFHVVRRADLSGRQEKVLVLETDLDIPQAGYECQDENLGIVLRQLERIRDDVESTFGKFEVVEIRRAASRDMKHLDMPPRENRAHESALSQAYGY